MGNAIKFTPNGGSITVLARLSTQTEAVEVSVVDTGIGISKEDIAKVFDKFFQAGERISTDISGTGIGLTISKEIVELHDGKIWVESEKGAGTRFIFTLPLK
jgi:signal transduction histidine kinase